MIISKSQGNIEFYRDSQGKLCLAAEIEGMSENLEIDFELDDYTINKLVEYLTPFQTKVNLIETYKLKIVIDNPVYKNRKFRQYKKKNYESKAKFLRYGKDIFKRFDGREMNGSFFKVESWQMGTDGKWKQIETPKEFLL